MGSSQVLPESFNQQALVAGCFALELPILRNGKPSAALMGKVLNRIVRPLIGISDRTMFYETKFSDRSWSYTGKRLPSILDIYGDKYLLRSGVEPIDGYESFWYGDVFSKGSARGVVSIECDREEVDYKSLFVRCGRPVVIKNPRAALYAGYESAKRYVQKGHARHVFLLPYNELGYLFVMASKEQYPMRVTDAIAAYTRGSAK